MTANTSASGGYLVPASTPAPLQSQALQRFVQQFIAGVSGLDGTLVRPRWQAEPPNIPPAATAWCAFGITHSVSDTFAFIEHQNTLGGGQDNLQRNEMLDVLCSFYDLGVDGLADQYAAIFRDGVQIPQNREVLQLQGMDVMYTGDIQVAPVLNKERWQYRVDIPLTLGRQIKRAYPVLNILIGDVHLMAEDPAGRRVVDETILVTNPET